MNMITPISIPKNSVLALVNNYKELCDQNINLSQKIDKLIEGLPEAVRPPILKNKNARCLEKWENLIQPIYEPLSNPANQISFDKAMHLLREEYGADLEAYRNCLVLQKKLWPRKAISKISGQLDAVIDKQEETLLEIIETPAKSLEEIALKFNLSSLRASFDDDEDADPFDRIALSAHRDTIYLEFTDGPLFQ